MGPTDYNNPSVYHEKTTSELEETGVVVSGPRSAAMRMVTATNVDGASLGKSFLGNFSPNNENIFLPHFLCLLSHVRISLLLPLWLLAAHQLGWKDAHRPIGLFVTATISHHHRHCFLKCVTVSAVVAPMSENLV